MKESPGSVAAAHIKDICLKNGSCRNVNQKDFSCSVKSDERVIADFEEGVCDSAAVPRSNGRNVVYISGIKTKEGFTPNNIDKPKAAKTVVRKRSGTWTGY